jgi:hypothetical protein
MAPPPLLGFNNNVRHRGRVFHIQTEDSGVRHARIVTHLFADGGRIVSTRRLDYSSYLGQADVTAALRRLMKDQHKAMFLALRSGEFDEGIDRIFAEPGMLTGPTGDSPRADAAPPARVSQPAEGSMGADGLESLRVESARPSCPEAAPPSAPTSLQAALANAANAERRTERTSVVQRRDSDAGNDSHRGSSEGTRRAAVFGSAGGPSPSIFNESQGIEASLGDAILSFLADDERDG